MCEYNIGYIDDDSSAFKDYAELLENYVTLKLVENCSTKQDVYNWILENKIECFIADFKLSDQYTFNGAELLEFLNKKLPDLVCIILTNYPCDSISENLVSSILIKNRTILSSVEGITIFGEELKQASEVFSKRLINLENDFSILLAKKREKTITINEEEYFIHLYSILKAYNKVDDLPNEMFKTEMSDKIDKILELTSQCISLEKKNND